MLARSELLRKPFSGSSTSENNPSRDCLKFARGSKLVPVRRQKGPRRRPWFVLFCDLRNPPSSVLQPFFRQSQKEKFSEVREESEKDHHMAHAPSPAVCYHGSID